MKGILHSVSRKDYFRYMIWLQEYARHQMLLDSQRTGRKLHFYKQTFIADLQEVSIKRLSNKLGANISLFFK